MASPLEKSIASGADPQADARDAFKVFVEIYKHHFELWLKAYLAYLAIMGVVAGILFKPETPLDSRKFLVLFVVTVSLLSVVAWSIGLVWLRQFEKTIDQLSAAANFPTLRLSAFKLLVFVGLIGALVISVSAIVLLRS